MLCSALLLNAAMIYLLCMLYNLAPLALDYIKLFVISLVPSPIPSFSLLHAEKREGLVDLVM